MDISISCWHRNFQVDTKRIKDFQELSRMNGFLDVFKLNGKTPTDVRDTIDDIKTSISVF